VSAGGWAGIAILLLAILVGLVFLVTRLSPEKSISTSSAVEFSLEPSVDRVEEDGVCLNSNAEIWEFNAETDATEENPFSSGGGSSSGQRFDFGSGSGLGE
jgi:hypothetical protein